ncbi:hypothetical protein AO263_31895 [Pseudomonas sp. NZIPFR-PS5]|nr:hypothetical protein AO263_31895 [Pseudomonas sp. NZIPFR-PS5]
MCAFRSALSRRLQGLTCACLTTVSPLCHADPETDPWEGFNRPVFSFNDTGDKYNFIRSVYLQTRAFKINGGEVQDDF